MIKRYAYKWKRYGSTKGHCFGEVKASSIRNAKNKANRRHGSEYEVFDLHEIK